MPRKLSKTSLASPTSQSFPPEPTPPPSTLSDNLPLPRLIVFDLDYTLWPFWVDTHVTPPLKASSTHTSCTDKFAESFAFYPDVALVLTSLRSRGIKIGAASRTQAPDLGREMLRLLHIAPPSIGGEESSGGGKARKAIEYFDYLETYPGSKTVHFEKLKKLSGVEYRDMLFFDDEARNRNVESLGVTMWLVMDGITRASIDNGIWEWRKGRGYGGRDELDYEVDSAS